MINAYGCSNFNHTKCHVHAQDDRIIFSEGCDLVQNAWENGLFSLSFSSLCFYFLHILFVKLSQMVNNVGGKNSNFIFSCIFLSISKDLDIKNQQARESILKQAYSFLLFYGFSANSDFMACWTSFFETGPTDTCDTGIFSAFR